MCQENGKIGTIKQYKEGVQNGIEKDYTNGILTYQANFINGKQDGELITFDWDGSGYEMTKGIIRNGKKVGDWKLCFDSIWHQCFHKSQIAFYRLAKLSEDGSQTAVDYYITGEKEGERTYDTSGKYILGIDYYKDGKLQEKYTWNPNTNKYDDINYNEDGSVKVSTGK